MQKARNPSDTHLLPILGTSLLGQLNLAEGAVHLWSGASDLRKVWLLPMRAKRCGLAAE